jgi:uncharacterized protein (DUF58 family)
VFLPRSADRLAPLLGWIGFATILFLALRAVLPPRPALTPLWLTIGIVAGVGALYRLRGHALFRLVAFGAVGIVAYLLAWNRGIDALYGFSAASFALVVVSYALPRVALRHIEGGVEVPAAITQGDRLSARVTVSNPGMAAARMLELRLDFGGALKSESWADALVVRLGGGASRTLEMTSPPMRRGLHTVGPLVARSGFPLGLVFAEQFVEGAAAQVWVYPRLFEIGQLPIAGEQFLDMGDAISPASNGVEEFAGVREYRHGDSRRHIHWRASAKRGELVVKEFMRQTAATVTIAVDLTDASTAGEGIETAAETAISIAASVARFALAQGHYVQLALCGAAVETAGPVRGLGSLEGLLRVLAQARTGGARTVDACMTQLAALAPASSTAVLVFCDGGRLPDTAAFRARAILVVPVFIDTASFERNADAASLDWPPGTRSRRARRGEDPAGLFQP